MNVSDAIKSGDMNLVSVGHGLLEVARSRMNGATEQLSILAGNRKSVREKRNITSRTLESTAKLLKYRSITR